MRGEVRVMAVRARSCCLPPPLLLLVLSTPRTHTLCHF
jgi:hypothetical protein